MHDSWINSFRRQHWPHFDWPWPKRVGSLCCNCCYEHSADNHKNDKYKAAFTSLTAVRHVRISVHLSVFHSAFTTLIVTENLMLATLLRAELSLWNKLQPIYVFNATHVIEKMLLWNLSLKMPLYPNTSQFQLNRTEKLKQRKATCSQTTHSGNSRICLLWKNVYILLLTSPLIFKAVACSNSYIC